MLNKIEFQGRLVRDPEIRWTESGIAVARITVAWSEKYKETETKCFLDCTAWRSTAEMLEKYFHKGKEIVIEGHMVTDQWKGTDGTLKSKTKCQVDKIHFCGPNTDSGSASKPELKTDDEGFVNVPDEVDEELPFS